MNTRTRSESAVTPTKPVDALEIFSTCPPSSTSDTLTYLKEVIEIAQWSEEAGCTGILVYSDNSLVDPWLVAQVIIENTRQLAPLVAVQPVYMHPYMLAKKVASLGFMYGRKIYLNMVAGGFKNDLLALDDTTPHDRRYDRLAEYTTIIKKLLLNEGPLTMAGDFYRVENLKLAPALPDTLLPEIFISGSSEAGLAAAKTIGATAIHYPKPATDYAEADIDPAVDAGIRIGIICREVADHAWAVARQRFPEDRKGQLTHQMAMKVSDSVWHKQLSELAANSSDNNPYWLVPFQNYKTMCPYLVGDYETVGRELKRYYDLGYQTFILDVPGSMEDLVHIRKAFDRVNQAG
ncbi:MAG: LLM class flavin-dependent oxidoreductase [Pseudomonadota bacterium]